MPQFRLQDGKPHRISDVRLPLVVLIVCPQAWHQLGEVALFRIVRNEVRCLWLSDAQIMHFLKDISSIGCAVLLLLSFT